MSYKNKFTQKHVSIEDIYKLDEEKVKNGLKCQVMGWILRSRQQQNLTFVHMYDGSSSIPFQLVIDGEKYPELFKSISPDCHSGACISALGTIILSPAKGQKYEMVVEESSILGKIENPATYLPCIKRPPLETIRPYQHLRPKFQVYQAIYKIRSKLLTIIHDFFSQNKFYHLDPNVITTADCEGGGEVFKIIPAKKIVLESKEEEKKYNPETIFFGKEAYLTVSSQLQLEALSAGLNKVYTLNPSFRAEQSKTRRHLCSFTHLEWEIAFIDLKDLMDFSEDLVSTVFHKILEQCPEELSLLDSSISKGIIDKLKSFIKEDFGRISYNEAIEIIQRDKKKILKKFKNEIKESEIPKWGDDLGSYCERYLCEDIYHKPLFVHSFPLSLKSFYMKPQKSYEVKLPDGTTIMRQTCDSCDLLIPGTGELIGSSIRQDDYKTLMEEVEKRKMDITPLQWYADLRKNGSFPHGGAGLGFDRLVTIVCFTEGNIRDAVPFPVSFGECYY